MMLVRMHLGLVKVNNQEFLLIKKLQNYQKSVIKTQITGITEFKTEIKKYTSYISPVALRKYSKKIVNVKGFRTALFGIEMYS